MHSKLLIALALVAAARVHADSELSISGFTLIDADTGRPIPGYESVSPGTTISIAELGTKNLDVWVRTYPADVGSLRLAYGTTERIDNTVNSDHT